MPKTANLSTLASKIKTIVLTTKIDSPKEGKLEKANSYN